MRRFLLFVFLLVSLAPNALGWGRSGHMLVAYIGYLNLDDATRKNVDELVALNPCYAEWQTQVASLPQEKQSAALFMLAATWPDAIKMIEGLPPYDCQPGHKFGPDGGTGPNGKMSPDVAPSTPEASQNIGYGDTHRHQYWHFVDTPFSTDGTNLEPTGTPNALTQLTLLSAALRTDEGDDIKSYDMVWIEHLVGDVHQPLHDTSRFTSAHPFGDAGGNLVLTCGTPGCKDELHAFWDDKIPGIGKGVEGAMALGDKLNQQPAPSDDVIDIENPADWVSAGFQLAKTVAYASPISSDSTGSTPVKPDAAYTAKAQQTMTAQIFLAGHRLARLLDDYLN